MLTPLELSELRVHVAAAAAIAADTQADSKRSRMFGVKNADVCIESLCDAVLKIAEVVAALVDEAGAR